MNPKDSVGAKKAPTRFVPQALVLEAAAVMATGAVKYGPFNWREQPVSAVTYGEAIQRHLSAWLEGQDNAEDSGLNHIAHIAASCGILLDAAANGTLLDDRTAGPAADILRRLDHSQPSTPATEPWGTGDGPIVTFAGLDLSRGRDVAVAVTGPAGGPYAFGIVDNRGEWPPDTRVDGRLTCCGQTDHALDCPQWR